MSAPYDLVLDGIPVSSRRGALGWCSVVLLRRASTTILFDTGSYGDRAPLLARLEALGIRPGDVDLIFASHFHFDHVVNAECFGCPVAISAPERAYVEGEGYVAARDPYVPRALFPFLEPRLVTVRDGEELAPGVRVVLLPGHTPGTAGLLLEDEGVLLASDAVKNAWEFVREKPPPSFFSADTTPANYRKVRQIAREVVPGHDRPFTLAPDGSIRCGERGQAALDVYADPAAERRVVNLMEQS